MQTNIYQNNKANILADDILEFPNYLNASLINSSLDGNKFIQVNNNSQNLKYEIDMLGIKSGGSLPNLLV